MKILYEFIPKLNFVEAAENVKDLIDGFNIYHSVVEACKDLKGISTKWLNLHSLCSSYLHVIGNNAQIKNIYYFSALATHLQSISPSKIINHKLFLNALKSVNVKIHLGRFKRKKTWCPTCNKYIQWLWE